MSFSASLGAWLSMTTHSELEIMVLPCTVASSASTFCVAATGKPLRLRYLRHAELKNSAPCGFSSITWNSSIRICVRLPFRQLSATRLLMASLTTNVPIVRSCAPKPEISYEIIRLFTFTLVGWENTFRLPLVNRSKARASPSASFSGCSSSF